MMYNYEEKNSVELLIEEIKKALDNKMYFAALCMSLIIPDMLGKLECNSDENRFYSKWFDENVRDCMMLTPKDREKIGFVNETFNGNMCFELRNSILHNAGSDIENRIKCNEFVLQLSDEPFVRGIPYDEDYDYANLIIDKDGNVSDECKIRKYYISAKEIITGIVNAAELYIKNNANRISKLSKIKINSYGGAVPKFFFKR
ncbi:MAG: hypothetical protein IJP71_07060 [Lachnospiraceae bacterium]|nr:hypothetical protein [Lachnospiraceae bacterium]